MPKLASSAMPARRLQRNCGTGRSKEGHWGTQLSDEGRFSEPYIHIYIYIHIIGRSAECIHVYIHPQTSTPFEAKSAEAVDVSLEQRDGWRSKAWGCMPSHWLRMPSPCFARASRCYSFFLFRDYRAVSLNQVPKLGSLRNHLFWSSRT